MHAENTIAVSVEEERRRAEEARRQQETARAAQMEEENMWRQKCDKLGGVYDGTYCVKGTYKYEKWYF
jgi:hypothetical protein